MGVAVKYGGEAGTHYASLSEGGALAVVVGDSPKRRIRLGTIPISCVRCGKSKRGCSPRVPPSPGVAALRTRGDMDVRAPLYLCEKDLERIIA